MLMTPRIEERTREKGSLRRRIEDEDDDDDEEAKDEEEEEGYEQEGEDDVSMTWLMRDSTGRKLRSVAM